ncbi:hypothetical protein [Flavobacterium piscis]|uniref:Uncharacterized protein n=1 Tax=Flavobacterium piscis TaxID=1114874 RepID=A0ABU1YC27_9FLAO|nr:hypothetical protein [Flavobacterium piscis]MDR7211807.1 hypothetical protein [Flavobacterium piscis]
MPNNKLHDKLEHLEKLILRISITEENKDELLNVEESGSVKTYTEMKKEI